MSLLPNILEVHGHSNSLWLILFFTFWLFVAIHTVPMSKRPQDESEESLEYSYCNREEKLLPYMSYSYLEVWKEAKKVETAIGFAVCFIQRVFFLGINVLIVALGPIAYDIGYRHSTIILCHVGGIDAVKKEVLLFEQLHLPVCSTVFVTTVYCPTSCIIPVL